jgi:hypothetical protein
MRMGRRAVWGVGLVATLLLPFPAASQLAVGVTGGLSLASITGDDADDEGLDMRTGFDVGGFLELPLADIVWLVPGIHYVQKGATFERLGDDFTIELDYAEVPLLLRVGVSQRNPLGINLLLGPTFAFQVKCELVDEDTDDSQTCEQQAASDLDLSKSFDLGLAVGGGLSFAVSPNASLLANVLWDIGVTSIDDSPAENDVKNEAILLNVGLAFRPGM